MVNHEIVLLWNHARPWLEDSMILAFRTGQTASGRRLCDTDKLLFSVAESRVKNWDVLVRQKYTDNLGFPIFIVIGIYILVV